MEEYATQADLVSKVEAEYLHRGTFISGYLTLTSKWLYFARLGEEGPEIIWKSLVRAVDVADVDIVRGSVSFGFQGKTYAVRGPGSFALHKEFVTQFWSLSREEDQRLITSGDAVLLQGQASLSLDNGIRMEGSLAVTGRGIRFLAEGDIDARHSAIQGLSAPLERITGLKLAGLNRGLELRVGNHVYQFWGPLVPKLYGVLTTLIGHMRDDLCSESDILTWTIGRFRGLVLQYGEFIASNRKITFVPTGKLDAFVGLNQEWHAERHQVSHVDVSGIGGRRLSIRTITGPQASFDRPNGREHFIPFLEMLLHDPTQAGGRNKLPTFDIPALAKWKHEIPGLVAGNLLFSSPAFLFEDSFSVRFGTLLMGEAKTYFVPVMETPEPTQVITLRTERLRPPEPGQLAIGQMQLEDGSAQARLLLGNKSVFTSDFWAHWRNEMDRSGKGHFHPSLKPGGENRREAYRAGLPDTLPTRVDFLDEEGETLHKSIDVRFLDVSIGGCCILAEDPIFSAPTTLIHLPTIEEGRYKLMRFQCMHSAEVGQFGDKWRHGLRFLDLSEDDADEVERLVMKLQRDDAFSRAVRRAGIEDETP